MRARIPVTCAQQRRIHDQMVLEYRKVADQEREDVTRRIIKTMIYCLNKEFGFGVGRCARAFNAFAEHLERSRDDEVFWEHIDRVVIDQMKIPFERDYTDRGRASSQRGARNV